MGLKEIWQAECESAFDAGDWDRLWNVMYAGAIGAVFQGKSVASFMLKNFLLKGGNISWDYTNILTSPVFPGFGDRWIKNAPSVKDIVTQLDNEARTKVTNQVSSGKQNGKITNNRLVVTKGDIDGDCYYAIGKFILNGEFNFSIEKDFRGKSYIKIERIYWLQEDYDWTPGAKGGILPHDYPIALITAGRAAVFNYYIKFGEPEYKIYL